MLRATTHDGVLRLRAWTRLSRAYGYEVSAYVTRGVLVDTVFPRAWGELAAWLRGQRLEGALVTHHHEDHGGNAGALAGLGVPVGMAPATREAMRTAHRPGLYRRLTWGLPAAPAPAPPDFAHPALALVPTPGHTPDHHVVWDAERETVFGGDLFIGVKVRIAHPGEDVRGQPAALRRVAALRPRRFFDAHRGPVDRPVERLLAKAQWIDDVVGAIERRAAEGWTSRAIEREVLGAGDLTGLVSRGDYAKRNLVASVLASRAPGAVATRSTGTDGPQ